MVPVVLVERFTPIPMKKGVGYAPMFEIVGWVEHRRRLGLNGQQQFNVGGQNCGQPALHALFGHGPLPDWNLQGSAV